MTLYKCVAFLLIMLWFPLSCAEDSDFDKIIDNLKTVKSDNSGHHAIETAFTDFKNLISKSKYFCQHKDLFAKESDGGYVSPICEFLAFLTSHSNDQNIAKLLDYLLKTGGPFGINNRQATASERFILELGAKSVIKTDENLANENYNTTQSTEIQKLQKAFLEKEIDPLDAPEVKAANSILNQHPDITNFALNSRHDRWEALIKFIKNPNFFHHEANEIWQNGHEKYTFSNCLVLLGFALDLSPRSTNHASLHTQTYLHEEWNATNQQMETAHNYVQWWFPNAVVGMGDGAKTPRITQHLVNTVAKDGKFLSILQSTMKLSFLRMSTFWGQALSTTGLKIVDKNWEENWIKSTHNYLRMSRILLWLKAFKMDEEYKYMQQYLKEATERGVEDYFKGKQVSIDYISGSLKNYWQTLKPEDLLEAQ